MAVSINLDISKRVDITCRKGDSFSLEMMISDADGVGIDLSLYTFKMEVRETDTSSVALLSSTNDDFQFYNNANGADGALEITATASAMEVESGLYVYDIQATTGSQVTTWFYGIFKINEDITV
jgi:hypothetical protein